MYEQPKKGMSTGAQVGIGCGAVALLVMLTVFGCTIITAPLAESPPNGETAETASEDEDTPTEGQEDTDGPQTENQEAEAGVSDGTYIVGEDIEAGTYRTEGPPEDSSMGMCYWARLASASGELDDIIANDNIQGPGVVTVDSGDYALELSGGCVWELEG